MEVYILGKKRKGSKDFHLVSEDQFGFNIDCFTKGMAVKLYNLTQIIWMNQGENVMVEPILNDQFDFCEFEKVVIKKAKHDEGIEKATFFTT